jgi:hypothetical protein
MAAGTGVAVWRRWAVDLVEVIFLALFSPPFDSSLPGTVLPAVLAKFVWLRFSRTALCCGFGSSDLPGPLFPSFDSSLPTTVVPTVLGMFVLSLFSRTIPCLQTFSLLSLFFRLDFRTSSSWSSQS